MTCKELNDKVDAEEKRRLAEKLYQLADAIIETPGSSDLETDENRDTLIESIQHVLRLVNSIDAMSRPFDPSHEWMLDVLKDLAEYARQNNLELTRRKIEECYSSELLSH